MLQLSKDVSKSKGFATHNQQANEGGAVIMVDFETEFRQVFYIISFCCVGFSISHIFAIYRIKHKVRMHDIASDHNTPKRSQRRLAKHENNLIRIAYFLIFSPNNS